MITKKPRILLYDLETSPNISYTWGHWEQNVLGYIEEWKILCFSYKWLGEKKVNTFSMSGGSTEKSVVEELWKLFDEADIIIAHNGDKFDMRKSNAKFLEYGLTPPSHYQTIDTLKVARKYFKFNSNKLNDLSTTLGIGKKTETGGFELWLGCMRDEPSAWKKMIEYCKHDVELLEEVYLKLLPWMATSPNYNVIAGTTMNCKICGHDHVQKRGFAHTKTRTYQRYQCMGCYGWSTGELIKKDTVILK